MNQEFSRLLKILWPDGASGHVTAWESSSKQSFHGVEDMGSLDEYNKRGANIYFGLATRAPEIKAKFQRGSKRDCVSLPAIALDVDLYDPNAHAADNLPRSIEEAEEWFSEVPEPSLAVFTGNGYHFYWVFESPLDLTNIDIQSVETSIKNFQETVIHKAEAAGYHVDLTHTVDRIWRAPGFVNTKTNKPVQLFADDRVKRYRHEDLLSNLKPGSVSKTQATHETPTGQEIPSDLRQRMASVADDKKRAVMQKVLNGESFAERGTRDAALYSACSTVAFLDRNQTAPDVLAEVFRPSLTAWANEPGAKIGVDEEVAKAADKIARAQKDYTHVKAKEEKDLGFLKKVMAPSGSDRPMPPPSEKYFIIQRDRTYHVYDFTKNAYLPPCTPAELPLVLRDAWPDGAPVDLSFVDDSGNEKQKKIPTILQEYATVAETVTYSLIEKKTTFDPNQKILMAAAAPLRDLSPKFHPKIDKWLRLIPEDSADLESFLDWIAVVTLHEWQCCALYMAGAPSIGKSLFTAGMSRIWRSGATDLENVIARFNDSLLECPLAIVDEKFNDHRIDLCGEIRKLIGNPNHQIEKKFHPVATLEGAIRILVTANDDHVLSVRGNGEMTQDARRATAIRILHMRCNEAAGRYLAAECPERDDWQKHYHLAEHALWLRDNRADSVVQKKHEQGKRFLVEGRYKAEFHDAIGSRKDDYYGIAEWLVGVFTRPRFPDKARGGLIRTDDGIFVSPKAVIETWGSLGLDERFECPKTAHAVSRALAPFSLGRRYVSETKKKMYELNVEYIAEIADQLEIETRDAVIEGAKRPELAP